jgi:hypothetical protein
MCEEDFESAVGWTFSAQFGLEHSRPTSDTFVAPRQYHWMNALRRGSNRTTLQSWVSSARPRSDERGTEMSSANNRAGASAIARLCGTMAVLALLVPVVPFPAPAQAEGDAGGRFTVLRTWQPTVTPPGMSVDDYTSQAQLLAAPASRRLYALGRSWLSAYDLDSLEPVGSGVMVLPAQDGPFNEELSAAHVDPVTEELRVARLNADGSVHLDSFASTGAGVVRRASVPLPGLGGMRVRAIYRHASRDMLWVAATETISLVRDSSPVVVAEVGLRPGGGEHWTTRIRECPGLIDQPASPLGTTALGLVKGSLYFSCRNLSGPSVSVPVPGGVGRLTLAWSAEGARTSPGEFRLFARDGAYYSKPSLFDERSGRLALGGRSFTLDVFDTNLEAYVGTIGMGTYPPASFSTDGLTGRAYVITNEPNTGLAAVDLPATPLRQGVAAPRFSQVEGTLPQSNSPGIDATTGRLFINYAANPANSAKRLPPRFLVVHDAEPPYSPLAPESVDVNTNGGPEIPGVTTATYSAAATGFGSRYRQIGGTGALVANVANIQGTSEGVRPGTREMRFAAVKRLTMGNDEAAAEAAGGYADEANTRADLNDTQPRDPDGNPVEQPGREPGDPQAFPPLADWPWRPAVCADFGGSGKETDARGARVTCRAALPTVGAYAVQDRTEAASVVVGHSDFRADSAVDGLRGTITTATATAKDIDVLGGLLRIQEVSAKAVASAHGQPGTTATSYARTVKEVTLSGRPLCGDGADTKRCDIRAVQREVNTRLAGKVRIHFPTPEESRSKGGYQAVVQRGVAELLEEVAINEQPSDQLDVPAVVITVYADNSQPGRTIVDLASVAVEARYGISGRGNEGSAGGIGGLGAGGSSGAVGDAIAGGGAPVFGMTPGDASALAGLSGLDGGRLRPTRGVLGAGRHLVLQGIGAALEVFPGWVLLLVPVYLAARRWLLLERATLLEGARI